MVQHSTQITMTPIKLLVSACGTLARPVNPNIGKGSSPSLWVLFDLANPERPLTERCEPGSEIMGEEVWQFQDYDLSWVSENDNAYKKYNDFKDFSNVANASDTKTRKAYHPIKENHLPDAEKATETVDQAADRIYPLNIHAFKEGAQWQQSQSNRQQVDVIELLEKKKLLKPGMPYEDGYNHAIDELTDILTHIKNK